MKKKLPLCILFFLFANGLIAAAPQPLSIYFGMTFPNGDDYHNTACSESTGYIHPQVGGGTPPYTYQWSNSATTLNIDNIPAGTYTITVTDAVSATVSASLIISSGPLQFTFVAPPFYPCHDNSGGAVVYHTFTYSTYFNGTPPYQFSSTAGYFIDDYDAYSNTPAIGSYTLAQVGTNTVTVTATDWFGCAGQETFSLPSTPVQNPTFTVTPACNSQANGSVTVNNLVPSSTGNVSMAIINASDTANWVNCAYPYTWWSGFPYTENNLPPGVHYLALAYESTNYNYCNNAPYYGCTEIFPFTIPDLGPNCSTVQGDVYVDLNANCTENAGEVGVPNTVIEFTPGPSYSYTDGAGHYSSNLIWGNFNMTQYPPAVLTQLCPANPYPITLNSSTPNVIVNFADTSNIPFDVAAHISHGAAHPGFNFDYGVSVQNLSYSSSGQLTVTLNYDPLLSFVSANPAPFSTSTGQVVWHLTAITNFQSAGASVTLSVPANPALIGYVLNASVNVSAATAETNLVNNTASTSHTITGSFDPNVKTVETPAATFLPATDGLFNYTIQFQNTGNDTAFNIEVIDTLNSNLDVRTFVPGASSHSYTTDVTGHGVIHFHFNNIYLPDSATDEPHSHGFISFQIRCKPNLPHGTNITNKSDIIFDFNPPVTTNTTSNTVDLSLAINATATTICAGQSVTLTMIPQLQGTPWRWRTGTCSGTLVGNGNSITVSPTVTTTYFVRDSAGTIPVGSCYRKTIIVNALPTASITPSGPTTFCQGNSVTLTASGANNYLWSNSATSQSINVSSSGNYFVTVTNANNCSASTSLSVTVNPLPTPSITSSGPTTFCAGNSVTLSAGGANNYLWSNSAMSQSINVSSSGNYVVTVTDGNNCSASTSVSVTVNPLPTASITPSGPTTLCAGNSVTLTSNPASSYLWSTSATTQSINVSTSGNYIVTVTDGNNCSSASPAITVTVNPNPPSPNIIQVLESLVSDMASGYQWYFNNAIIPGATSQSYHPTQSGSYSVVITDVNGCTASSSGYPFIPTSAENISGSEEISIYPNPAGRELKVQSSKFKVESIEVFDMVGKNLFSQQLKANSQKQAVLDVSKLQSGIYFLRVKTELTTVVRKFVKE